MADHRPPRRALARSVSREAQVDPVGDATPEGYLRDDLADAFGRYLAVPAATSATTSKSLVNASNPLRHMTWTLRTPKPRKRPGTTPMLRTLRSTTARWRRENPLALPHDGRGRHLPSLPIRFPRFATSSPRGRFIQLGAVGALGCSLSPNSTLVSRAMALPWLRQEMIMPRPPDTRESKPFQMAASASGCEPWTPEPAG